MGRGANTSAPGGAPCLLPLLLYLLHAGGQRGAVMATQSKLVPADGARDDYFGGSVALSADGRTALVGALYDDDKGSTHRCMHTCFDFMYGLQDLH
jgi:hypothetical protein